MKSYFLSHISISPSQLLTPSTVCAYEEAIVQFNEHPFATLTQSPDFLKTNLSLLLSIMYFELAFYL